MWAGWWLTCVSVHWALQWSVLDLYSIGIIQLKPWKILAVNRNSSTGLHRCDEVLPVLSRSGMRWEKDVLDYAGVFFSHQISWQTLHTQLWLKVRDAPPTNAKSGIYKQSVFILSPALAVLPPCWRYPPRWRQSGSLQTDEYCAIKNSH